MGRDYYVVCTVAWCHLSELFSFAVYRLAPSREKRFVHLSAGRRGGGAYLFVACLTSHSLTTHFPFETEHRSSRTYTSNVWALITFSPYITYTTCCRNFLLIVLSPSSCFAVCGHSAGRGECFTVLDFPMGVGLDMLDFPWDPTGYRMGSHAIPWDIP